MSRDEPASDAPMAGGPMTDEPAPDAPPAGARDVQAEADRLIKGIQANQGVEEAVYAVAVLANRAAAELHRLTRAEATARKGTPEWGTWAALQNAARKLVLDATSARDGAARIVGRRR